MLNRKIYVLLQLLKTVCHSFFKDSIFLNGILSGVFFQFPFFLPCTLTSLFYFVPLYLWVLHLGWFLRLFQLFPRSWVCPRHLFHYFRMNCCSRARRLGLGLSCRAYTQHARRSRFSLHSTKVTERWLLYIVSAANRILLLFSQYGINMKLTETVTSNTDGMRIWG